QTLSYLLLRASRPLPSFPTRRSSDLTWGASRAVAGRAHLGQREDDGNFPPERGHPERDRHRRLDLFLFLFPRSSASPPPSEDRREQVPEPSQRAQVGNVEVHVPAGRRPGSSAAEARPPTASRSCEWPVAPQLIVLLALLRITQHVVCLVDLLEAVRRLRVVGVAI